MIYKESHQIELKLKKEEIEAIKLVDIDKLKLKNCAKKMKINLDEFIELLANARFKLAQNLEYGNIISIELQEDEPIDDTLYFTFRCAVCGTIYKISGYEERIGCPLCLSNKVMSAEEAGFDKKSYWC